MPSCIKLYTGLMNIVKKAHANEIKIEIPFMYIVQI